jgi:hypothetical protein
VLCVECTKCGWVGRYPLHRLIDQHRRDVRIIGRLDQLIVVPRAVAWCERWLATVSWLLSVTARPPQPRAAAAWRGPAVSSCPRPTPLVPRFCAMAKCGQTTDPTAKRDYAEMARRWRGLGESYQFVERVERFLADSTCSSSRGEDDLRRHRRRPDSETELANR